VLVVQTNPLLGELVSLPPHFRLCDGKILRNGDPDAIEKP
jgi:hypothetical protein